MTPIIPNYKGYIEGPNGEELRTPLEQIGKNKEDIEEIKQEITDIQQQEISQANDLTLNKVRIGEGINNANKTITGGTTDKSFVEGVVNNVFGNNALINTLLPLLTLKPSRANAEMSIAIGADNVSSATGAITYGYDNTSSGWCSTAAGALNTTTGAIDLAIGYKNNVSGNFGVAIGMENIASNDGSIAIGNGCNVSGRRAIAIGDQNTVEGHYSAAIGADCVVSGGRSFAQGTGNQTPFNNSYAGGLRTITGRDNQTVVGQYNKVSGKALFIVGDGSSNNNRTNVLEVNDDGTATLNGKLIATQEYIDQQIAALRAELT